MLMAPCILNGCNTVAIKSPPKVLKTGFVVLLATVGVCRTTLSLDDKNPNWLTKWELHTPRVKWQYMLPLSLIALLLHPVTFPAFFSDPLRRCGSKLSYAPVLGKSASLLTNVIYDLRARPENVLLVSSLGYELPQRIVQRNLHLISGCQSVTNVLFCLRSGGCLIWRLALSMPSAVFYLACAVWLTSQCSPASAGSRSAAQTTVIRAVFMLYFVIML